jgi:hypothetical protein
MRVTPDAAATIAQVNVGLMIALIVETKIVDTKEDEEVADKRGHGWLHAVGINGTFISLFITIVCVAVGKDIGKVATTFSLFGASLGAIALIFGIQEIVYWQAGGFAKRISAAIIQMTAMIWMLIWYYNYAGTGFWIK